MKAIKAVIWHSFLSNNQSFVCIQYYKCNVHMHGITHTDSLHIAVSRALILSLDMIYIRLIQQF